MKGLIFDIRRFSVHDGPGIRTTVFMKGCPLSCWWCHNPESRSAESESYLESHRLDGREFSKETSIGKEIETAELIRQIEKDQVFMMESQGGVTFSGGEPLFQPLFLEEALRACTEKNIDTALDTSGYAPAAVMKQILPFTNLFLFDIKQMDDSAHINYTGVSNKIVLSNLELIAGAGKRIWIRIPLIEDINDQHENMQAISKKIKGIRKNIELINLLPYHTIGKSKYSKFGKENRMENINNYPAEKSEMILKYFTDEGFRVKIGG